MSRLLLWAWAWGVGVGVGMDVGVDVGVSVSVRPLQPLVEIAVTPLPAWIETRACRRECLRGHI
jgi:hypothetical protein